jgi:hypothetical protein
MPPEFDSPRLSINVSFAFGNHVGLVSKADGLLEIALGFARLSFGLIEAFFAMNWMSRVSSLEKSTLTRKYLSSRRRISFLLSAWFLPRSPQCLPPSNLLLRSFPVPWRCIQLTIIRIKARSECSIDTWSRMRYGHSKVGRSSNPGSRRAAI